MVNWQSVCGKTLLRGQPDRIKIFVRVIRDLDTINICIKLVWYFHNKMLIDHGGMVVRHSIPIKY